ncbi:MAG: hypothetical protein DRO73_10640 [Candidatus Thorarchaeota archaeon]|nr:MAG: hypothetical protein DRO73_10640 [Candidatus Thorarchaeota archaeon]
MEHWVEPMTTVALDTSFLIDFLAGDRAAKRKMQELEEEIVTLAVPSIVAYELLVLSSADRQPERQQKALNIVETLLSRLPILWPFDRRAARLAADIQRANYARGTPLSVRDLLIAATAMSNGCNTIVTRNKRDFERIEGVHVESY